MKFEHDVKVCIIKFEDEPNIMIERIKGTFLPFNKEKYTKCKKKRQPKVKEA